MTGAIDRFRRSLYVISRPRVTINELAEGAGLDYRTANRCVKDLVADGILVCDTSATRNRIYTLQRYLEIFRTSHP